MGETEWEVVYEADGQFQAELLRGLLEAQEIPVVLSQEGVGRVYGLTVGTLGRVEILVPVSRLDAARQILQDYASGSSIDADAPEADLPDFETD
jgi:hypothetical protein